MGKKGKPIKLKQYKVPSQKKFLVVINPWGVYGNFDQADLNHIDAWFAVMLRDEYPNTRLNAIYYQRTHQNIIVELPKEVDIELLLGAHSYSKFFMNAPSSEDVAYIYEYKYATFGDPTDKTFTMGQASYKDQGDIPPDFPIRDPYPLPSPAPPPPMGVPYARPIPPEVNERIANRLQIRDRTRIETPEPGPSTLPEAPRQVASRNESLTDSPIPLDNGKGKAKEIASPLATENNFTPYVRPGYLSSGLAERLKQPAYVDSSKDHIKMDPYDKEAQAKCLLNYSDKEDDAQVFLSSLLNGIKTEEAPDQTGSTYKPSADLLDALSTLPGDLIEPNVRVKAEEAGESLLNDKPESTLSNNSDYQPSDDLLAALATLPGDMTARGERDCPVKSEPLQVKEEPQDVDISIRTPKNFSSSQCSRSWDMEGVNLKRASPNKRYSENDLYETGPESLKRIKKEN